MKSVLLPGCLAVLACGLWGQPPCGEFEVASVKPAPPLDLTKAVAFGRQIDGAQIRFTQTSLRDLLRVAWTLRDYQIEAPEWLASARFNVSAKLPESCTQKQVPAMLQALLADRFALQVHRATKELPVYFLVRHGDTLKLKKAPEEPAGEGATPKPDEVKLAGAAGRGGTVDYGGGSYFAMPHYCFEGRKLPMDILAPFLARMTDRPVLDRTGLAGRYDFDLELAEDDYDALTTRAAMSVGVAQSPKDLERLAAAGDPLPRVLRTLGFDLKAGKGPVEVLIVDRIRKDPAEN